MASPQAGRFFAAVTAYPPEGAFLLNGRASGEGVLYGRPSKLGGVQGRRRDDETMMIRQRLGLPAL